MSLKRTSKDGLRRLTPLAHSRRRKADIRIKNLQKKIPLPNQAIKKTAYAALASAGIHKKAGITFCFVNNRIIRKLNSRYLGKNYSTDVLCFDLSPNQKEILGEIAISTDAAVHNARIFKTTPRSELYLYVIHGLLHLLGYDDNNSQNRKIMQKKAAQILSNLNII